MIGQVHVLNMDITALNNIIKRPTEKYILQKKEEYQIDNTDNVLKDEVGNIITKDEIGNTKINWQDVVELKGVIQLKQKAQTDESGEESKIEYVGYFNPKKFNLDTNKLSDYRVKIIRNYETVILKITEFNPNLFLRNDKHHYKMGFTEDKKYGREST